jgi:hypothetical protein
MSHIVLTWEKDEYVPIFMATGHNLKEANRFFCDTQVALLNNPNFFMIHKKVNKDDKKMDIFLTHGENDVLIRGFLYYNNKEYKVLEHRSYDSLQIEQWCYGNISVIRLEENIFA